MLGFQNILTTKLNTNKAVLLIFATHNDAVTCKIDFNANKIGSRCDKKP
jgi:hypothetical protein